MRILITGGAGFIGSHLADRLLAEGHQVLVLDNLSTGRIQNIHHMLGNPAFQFINSNILERRTVEECVRQVDHIYHLAAVVGVKYVVEDPLRGMITNVRGTELVLEAAFRYWKSVMLASSSEVYGKSEKVPLHEESDSIIGPTTVGRWSYSLSKVLDEHLGLAYYRQGLPVSIVRYFNTYGPRLDPRGYGSVIGKFLGQALGNEPLTVFDDGQQTRCFTFVEDIIRGTILAGTVPEAVGQAFNIGSDRETKVRDLAEMVLAVSGATSPIEYVPYRQAYGESFEETRRRVPAVDKAKGVLGFEASVSLEDGLRKTWRWFKETFG
ncbi:MAG: GDP-mannose 4,6-dehydratase [Anaerolineae bacterium]